MRRELRCGDVQGLGHDLRQIELGSAFGVHANGGRRGSYGRGHDTDRRLDRSLWRGQHLGRRLEAHDPRRDYPARNEHQGQPRHRGDDAGNPRDRERGHGGENHRDQRHAPRPPLPDERARAGGRGCRDQGRHQHGGSRVRPVNQDGDRRHDKPELAGHVSLLHPSMVRNPARSRRSWRGARPRRLVPEPGPRHARARPIPMRAALPEIGCSSPCPW